MVDCFTRITSFHRKPDKGWKRSSICNVPRMSRLLVVGLLAVPWRIFCAKEEEAQVTPIRLVQAYAKAARNCGAVFYEHTNVVAFQRAVSGQRITGVTTASGEVVLCEHLILATGVWSAEVGQHLGIALPVYPV